MRNLTSLIILLLALSCNNNKNKTNNNDNALTEMQTMIAEGTNYLENRDLDGDGIDDKIVFDFSGGAHCCYKISLHLSSIDSLIKFPFEMDGGYEFGVDGSQPNHFSIEDFDKDGLPEIFMEISTYNGEKYPVKKEWTILYGIKTNYIFLDFYKGNLRVLDFVKEKVYPE